MRARTVVVVLALVAVVGTGAAAVLLTLRPGDGPTGVTTLDVRSSSVADDESELTGEGRRHVGAGGEVVDADEPETAEPEGPATKAQRLQWIREWLEIACGDGYAWGDRMKAQKAILRFDEAESVPLILALATDPDPDSVHWGWAVNLLGDLGPRAAAAVPDLVKMLRRDEDRGSAAAYTLGFIGEPAVDALIACASDADPEVQLRALYGLALVREPPRRLTETLIGLLGHADAQIRGQAIDGLRRPGCAPDLVIPALTGALSDSSKEVRWRAVLWLSARGPAAAPAVGALINALDDEDASVSFWAAKALGAIGPASAPATEKLVALLAAEPSRWKDAIPAALSDIGTDALLKALTSPSTRVRVLSIPFLPISVGADETTAPAAVAALDSALASEDADVRRAAADALGAMGPTASTTVATLLKLADDATPVVRRAALIAVVRVGGARESVLDVLIRELRHGPDIARAAAAEALGELGPNGAPAVDALAAAMNDPDLVVRERAARALESIGPAAISAASAIAGRLGDDAERVRLAAAIALIAVDPPGLAARDRVRELRISDAPKIRQRLMEGLGRHPNAVWLDVVVNRIDDRNADVRDAAAQAAARYTAHSPTVVPALVARLEKERIAGVQIAIANALAKHGKDAADAASLMERYLANPRILQPVREAMEAALERVR